MARNEIDCPVCDGVIPLHGDEVVGEEVFCGFCGVRSELTKPAADEDCELEADW